MFNDSKKMKTKFQNKLSDLLHLKMIRFNIKVVINRHRKYGHSIPHCVRELNLLSSAKS